MGGETGVGKSHEPPPGDDSVLLRLRKPEISNMCTCRTEQVHLASQQNSGKPQNGSDNVPSSGGTKCVGQPLMILV